MIVNIEPALLMLMLLSMGCATDRSDTHLSTLEKGREGLEMAKAFTYSYSSDWDNRFNESTWSTKVDIAYSRLHNSDHGYGLSAKLSGQEYIYDGQIFTEVDHNERRIVKYPRNEVATDSNYFENTTFFGVNPFTLQKINPLTTGRDTMVNGQRMVVFVETEAVQSVADSTKTVFTETQYVLEKRSGNLKAVQTTTMIETDTVQIIHHALNDLVFCDTPTLFTVDSVGTLGYSEASSEDLDNEMALQQAGIGHKLEETEFVNTNGTMERIAGTPGRTSIVMFSFIGCGGCEYAMKEMSRNDYKFRGNIDFYYSSPIDQSDVLKRYLGKKEYSGIAFGKESGMNEAFSAYTFPTFFVIDDRGVVMDVQWGYGDEIREVLFN